MISSRRPAFPLSFCFRALTYDKTRPAQDRRPSRLPPLALRTHGHAMSSRLLADYASLATYTEDQLKDLLTQDDYLDAFLYSLPQVQGVLDRQQELSRTNDELASTSSRGLFSPCCDASIILMVDLAGVREEPGVTKRVDRVARRDGVGVFDGAASAGPVEGD